jgi:hypothetical protein
MKNFCLALALSGLIKVKYEERGTRYEGVLGVWKYEPEGRYEVRGRMGRSLYGSTYVRITPTIHSG